MNDEETVALTAGGHAFGKCHGAAPSDTFGTGPEGEGLHRMGFGWLTDPEEIGKGHITTSGIEGAWTPNPTEWGNDYFRLLFKYEYELTQSPAGAHQWTPIDPDPEDMAPDARDPNTKVPTIMTTADMALKRDPEYRKISERFLNDQAALDDAFARAWFKLDAPRHGSQGPLSRFGGSGRRPDLAGSDPRRDQPSDSAVADFKKAVLDSGLSVSELVKAAWASASTYRNSDHRAAAPTARISASMPCATGRSMIRKNWARCWRSSTSCAAISRWPMPSCSAVRQRSKRRPRTAASISASMSPPAAAMPRGPVRCRKLGAARAFRRRLPQLPQDQGFGEDRGHAGRQGPSARPVDARNDRAARRDARAGRGLQAAPRTAIRIGVLTDRPGVLSTTSSSTCSAWARCGRWSTRAATRNSSASAARRVM